MGLTKKSDWNADMWWCKNQNRFFILILVKEFKYDKLLYMFKFCIKKYQHYYFGEHLKMHKSLFSTEAKNTAEFILMIQKKQNTKQKIHKNKTKQTTTTTTTMLPVVMFINILIIKILGQSMSLVHIWET